MADEEKPATSYAQSKDPYAKKGKDKGLGSIIGGNLKNIIPKEPEILSENPYAPPPSDKPVTDKEKNDTLKLVNDRFGGKGGAGGGGPAVEAGKVKTVEEIKPENTGMKTPTPSDFLGQGDIDTANREFAEQEAERKKKMEVPQVENVPEEGGSDKNPEGTPAETPEEGGKKKPSLTERFVNWYTNDETGLHSANEQKEIDDKKAEEAKMAEQDARRDGTFVDTSTIEYNEKPPEDENPEKIPEKPVTEEDYTVKYGQVAVDSAKRWGKLLALPVAQGILDSNFGDNTVAAFDSTRKILRSFLTGNPMSAASTILGESVNNLNRFSDTADKIGKRMGIAVGADPTLLEGTIVGRSFKRRADEDRQATSAALKVVDDAMTSLGEDSLENLTPEKLTQFYDTIGQANSQAVSTLKRYFDGDETVTKRDRDLALRQIEVYGSVMDDITKKSKQDKEKYAADAAWLRKVGSNRNRMEKMRQEIQHKRRYDSATDLGKLSIDLLGRNVLLNQAGEPVRKNDITRMKNTLEAKLASNELSQEDRAAYQKALDRITQLATPYDEVQWQKMLDETTDKGRIIATLTSKRIPVDKNGSYDSFHAKTVARRAREYITTHPDISDEDRKLYEEIAREGDALAMTGAQMDREMRKRAILRKMQDANPIQRKVYSLLPDNMILKWNLDDDGLPAAPGQLRHLSTTLKNEIIGGELDDATVAEFESLIDKIENRLIPGKEQANRRYAAELDLNNVTDPSGNVHLKFIHGALDTRRDIRFDLNTGLPASASDYQSLSRQIENTLNDPEKLSRLSGSMAPDTVKNELEYYKNNILDPAMRKDYQVRADDKRAKATPEQMRVYNLLDDRQVAEWNLDANGMPGSKTQKRNLRTRIENALLDPSIPDSEKAALKAMRDEITKGLRTEFERSNEEYRASLYNDPDTKNLGYVYDTLTRFKGIRFDPDTKLPASPRDYAKLESSIRNAMKDPEYLKNHPAIGKASTEAILQSYLDKKLLPAMRSQRAKDYEEWKRNAQDDNVRLLGEALGGERGTIDIKPDGSIAKGRRAAAIRKIQDYLFNSDLPADDPGRQYLADKAAKWQQAIDVENMDKRATVKKRKILEDDTKPISERLGALWDVDDVALESVTGKALSAHQVDSSANKAALMQTAYMKKNYPLVYNALTEYDSIDEMASDGPEMNDDELREEAKRLLADPMYIANQHAVDNLRMASDTQRYQKMIHNAGQAMQLNPQEIQRDIDRLSVLSYQTIQSKSEDPTKVGEYIPLSADSPYQKELDALMDKYNLRGKFKASGKKGAVNLGPVAVDEEKVDNKDGIHFFFSDYTQNNMANIAIQINNYYGTGAYSSGPASAKGGVKFGAGYTSEEPSEESPETPVTPEPEKEKGEKPEQEQSDKTKVPSKGMFAKQTHYRESDDAQEDPRGAFSIDDGKGGFRPMSKDEVSKLKGRVEAAKKSKDINEVKAMLDELDSTIHFSGDELDKRSQFYSDKYMEYYGKERPTTGKYSDYIDSRIYGVDGGFSNAKKILTSREELQQKYDQLLAEENAKKEAEAREARRQQDERDADAAIHEYGDVLEDEGFRNYEDRESWRDRKNYWDEQDEDTIDKIFSGLNPDVRTPASEPEKEQPNETVPPANPEGEGEVGGETPQAPEIKGSRFKRSANGTLEIPDELKVPDTKFFRRNNSNAGPGFDEKLYGKSHAAHAISSMISEIGGKIANKPDNMSGSNGGLVLAPEYKSSLKLFSNHINKLDEEGNTGESLADKYYLVSLFKRQGMDSEFGSNEGKFAAMNATEKNKQRKSFNNLFYSTFSKDIANFDELSQDEAFVNNLNEDYNAINQFLHEEDVKNVPPEVLDKLGSLHKDVLERTGRYAKSEEEKQVDEKKKAEEEAAAKKRKQEIDELNAARTKRYEEFKSTHPDEADLITDPATLSPGNWNGAIQPNKIPILTSEGKEITEQGGMQSDIDALKSIVNYTADPATAKDTYETIASRIKGNLDAIREEYDLWKDQIERFTDHGKFGDSEDIINTDLMNKINPFYTRLASGADNIIKLLNEAENNLKGDYLKNYNEVKEIKERGRKDSGTSSFTYYEDLNPNSRTKGTQNPTPLPDNLREAKEKELAEREKIWDSIKPEKFQPGEMAEDIKFLKEQYPNGVTAENYDKLMKIRDRYLRAKEQYKDAKEKLNIDPTDEDDSRRLAELFFSDTQAAGMEAVLNNLDGFHVDSVHPDNLNRDKLPDTTEPKGTEETGGAGVDEGMDLSPEFTENVQNGTYDVASASTAISDVANNLREKVLGTDALQGNQLGKGEVEKITDLFKKVNAVEKYIAQNKGLSANQMNAIIKQAYGSVENRKKLLENKNQILGSLTYNRMLKAMSTYGYEDDANMKALANAVRESIRGGADHISVDRQVNAHTAVMRNNPRVVKKKKNIIVKPVSEGESVVEPEKKPVEEQVETPVEPPQETPVEEPKPAKPSRKKLEKTLKALENNRSELTKDKISTLVDQYNKLYEGLKTISEDVRTGDLDREEVNDNIALLIDDDDEKSDNPLDYPQLWDMLYRLYTFLPKESIKSAMLIPKKPGQPVKIKKSTSSRDAMKALFDEKMEEHNARFEAYNSVDKRRFMQ